MYRNDDGPSRSSSSENAIYVDLFAECLGQYGAVSLLNDFEFTRQHRAGTEELRDCKLSDPLSVCCGGLVRECRESEDENGDDGERFERFKRYWTSLDERQRMVIETTTKIHCFFNHSIQQRAQHELHDNEEKEDSDRVLRRRSIRHIVPKFVNEMDTTHYSRRNDDGTFKTKMDDLTSILASHRNYSVSKQHTSRSLCGTFHEFEETEQMDSDAIFADLHDAVYRSKSSRESVDALGLSTSADSNLFSILRNDSVLVKNVLHHFNQLNVFEFGQWELFYWKHWKTYGSYIESPKYKNLKEECLHNGIHSMSGFAFHQLLVHGQTLWMTDECRRMKSSTIGGKCQAFLIPGESPLSLSHLFVLLMYCNLTKLQAEYKKHGCRGRTSGATITTTFPHLETGNQNEIMELEELKKRNSEIGWWYKLIYESIMLWGTPVEVEDIFYTGLDQRMLFDSMVPIWNCPFSTSVSSTVAMNFATMQGVILKMKRSSSRGDPYMNCEWFSDYPDEQERLFMVTVDLRIVDIQTFDFENGHWLTSRVSVSALALFSSILEGHWIAKLLKNNAANDAVTMLLMMIKEYKASKNGNYQPLTNNSLYVEQMFEHLIERFRLKFKRKKPWTLIKSEHLLLSEHLRHELLEFDNSGYVRISPFLRSLGCSLDGILEMEEYIWIITGKELDKFKAMDEGHLMKSKTLLWQESGGMTIRFEMQVVRNMDGSPYTGFGFHIVESPYHSIRGVFGVNIDEVDWYINSAPFQTHQWSQQNVFSFKDRLLMDMTKLTIRFVFHFALSVRR